jgi:hypothetical protein
MTPDGGGDLELDAGAAEGSYLLQDGANPYVDTGAVGKYRINLQFDAKSSGGAVSDETNEVEIILEIDLATTAGPIWQGWQPYLPGEYECRWYRIRATVKVDPAYENRPKFLRFEHSHTPIGAVPMAAAVDNLVTAPTGSEPMGTRYIVIATASGPFTGKEDQIADLVETTGNTWEFFIPINRQEVYNLSNGWKYRYEGSYAAGSWVPRGLDNSNPEEDRFIGAITVVGAKDLLWDTDGGGDIGASGASRPDYVHAKTGMTINGVPVSTGAAWYQVLDSTATASDINTALADAGTFVVFLEPGTYSLGNNNISIPAQKALVGLGGVFQGSGAGADLTIEVDATNRVQMASGSRLENVKLRFASTSTAGNEMIETSTNDGVVIRGVNVDGSAVGAGNGIVSWAIRGAVKEVTHCSFFRCAGIYVDQTTQDEGGKSEFGWIHWTAHLTDVSISMLGIQIDSGPVWVHDVHGENGYGTLYVNNANDILADRIWCESNDIYSIYWTGNDGILSGVYVDGGNYGSRISGHRMVISDFYVRDTINRGFWFETGDDCSFESIHAYNCGGTSNTGIHIQGSIRSTLTNISSYSAGGPGIYMNTLQRCTVSGVNASEGGSSGTGHHGIYIDTCPYSSFSALTGYDNNFGHGIFFNGSDHISASGLSAYGNGQHGIVIAVTDRSSFSSLSANNNGIDGVLLSATCDYNTVAGISSSANTGDGMQVSAGAQGNMIGNLMTQGNGAWGFNGGNAGGAANNTLHGHVSHADTSGNRTLGTGWNSADLW